jgi:transposase
LPEQVAALAAAAELPLELWAMDESRFGLHTITRRRLTLPGIKPVGVYQQVFKNFYVYGAVAPRTGEGYFETRLTMNATDFAGFLAHFAAQAPERFHIIVLDNARSHHATTLQVPSNVALLFLPPYAPELNPCERVWQALKDRLAWHTFPDLVALQDTVAALVEGYEEHALRSLVAYPFLCAAMDQVAAA